MRRQNADKWWTLENSREKETWVKNIWMGWLSSTWNEKQQIWLEVLEIAQNREPGWSVTTDKSNSSNEWAVPHVCQV